MMEMKNSTQKTSFLQTEIHLNFLKSTEIRKIQKRGTSA